MSTHPVSYITPEEYLERERVSDTRHEYVDGEVMDMAGGSPAHGLIGTSIAGELRTRLKGSPCFTLNSDVRIAVQWGRMITYPDVSVVCGQAEYIDDRRDTITNSRVIVEVLSPSTSNYDRGEKSRRYRMLPSLAEFLLIEQTPVEIEHYRRLPDGHWDLYTILDPAAVIRLESINCEIPVSEIYRDLDRL